MEARILSAITLFAVAVSSGAGYRSANFIVEALTPALAEKIGKTAERYRRDLAIEWLGSPMPNWSRPCPIQAEVGPNLGAGGQTSFVFDRGEVFGWDMRIQGSEERLLDSVLPHEVTHTIFASYFRRPLPRWADEGACTTVEHAAERNKQQQMLINFLRTGHGIAFHQMFAMKEYPPDVLPLYSQGYSLARFLIDQGGRQKFLEFVGDGMKAENWSETVNKHYGFANLKVLQAEWLEWVKRGSPPLNSERPATMLASAEAKRGLTDAPNYRAQSDDRNSASRPERKIEAETGQQPGSSASAAGSREAASQLASGSDASEAQTAAVNGAWNAASRSVMGSISEQESGGRPQEPANANRASATTPDFGASAGRKSVYDRRQSSRTTPASIPERRDPEYVARRDTPPGAKPEHQVLLEWTRPQ